MTGEASARVYGGVAKRPENGVCFQLRPRLESDGNPLPASENRGTDHTDIVRVAILLVRIRLPHRTEPECRHRGGNGRSDPARETTPARGESDIPAASSAILLLPPSRGCRMRHWGKSKRTTPKRSRQSKKGN